jgi:hypothetical protein
LQEKNAKRSITNTSWFRWEQRQNKIIYLILSVDNWLTGVLSYQKDVAAMTAQPEWKVQPLAAMVDSSFLHTWFYDL